MSKLNWIETGKNIWSAHLEETHWDDPADWRIEFNTGNLHWIYQNDKLICAVQYLESAKKICELLAFG